MHDTASRQVKRSWNKQCELKDDDIEEKDSESTNHSEGVS